MIRLAVAAVCSAVLVFGGYLLFGGPPKVESSGTTFEARQGPLEVTVVSGGSVEAKDSLEVKCEVQGATKILKIVDEGYFVTPEDVELGKVLVELDTKDLLDRKVEHELSYQAARAGYTEAREAYEIQLNQNESDMKAAELEMKFARMDLEKYLGVELATGIIDELNLEVPPPITAEELQRAVEAVNLLPAPPLAGEEAVSAELPTDAATAAAGDNESAPVANPEVAQAAEETAIAVEVVDETVATADVAFQSTFVPRHAIDFSKYADPEQLGDGEARQKLREFENNHILAQEEVGQARTQLEGTKRLFEKDFVTREDLDNDELALKRKTIAEQAAETNRELFIRYEFPKQAEKLLSDYEESLRKLERARKLAVSRLAQADAKLNSMKAQYELQQSRRQEIFEQIEKCIIKAEKPGLIVYGTGGRNFWEDDQIREGAMVREQQAIFTIPDTTVMAVEVGVHESFVKRIVEGQRARITVDAFSEKKLSGTVYNIAVLPDSENRWINPDLKTYPTKIVIDGKHDWLKPGMNAEAEIVVDVLANVVQVPIQAVVSDGGEEVVFLDKVAGAERSAVVTGEFNESFIEIKEGLKPGQQILLLPPEGYEISRPEPLIQAIEEEGAPEAQEAEPGQTAAVDAGGTA